MLIKLQQDCISENILFFIWNTLDSSGFHLSQRNKKQMKTI